MGLAVGTALLSCFEADICVFPVYWSPSWIFDFRSHRTLFGIAPLSSWKLKMGLAVGTALLSYLVAEI